MKLRKIARREAGSHRPPPLRIAAVKSDSERVQPPRELPLRFAVHLNLCRLGEVALQRKSVFDALSLRDKNRQLARALCIANLQMLRSRSRHTPCVCDLLRARQELQARLILAPLQQSPRKRRR